MAIKNTGYGGTDWAEDDVLYSADLNDTFDATINYYTTPLSYALPPIGSILAYDINSALSNGEIPSGWLDCNGQTVSDADSPLNGQVMPNLNGDLDTNKRFLKGATTSGATGGTDTHGHSYSLSGYMDPGTNSYRAVNGISGNSNIPPYYEIRWIIRIK